MTLVELGGHGRRYRIHDPGSHIGDTIRTGIPYEAVVLQDMYARRVAGAVAVDAGAHVGNHSLWLAAVCGMRVHAFEPAPANATRLLDNVLANPGLPVTVHRVALGAAPGHATMIGTPDDIDWGRSPVAYGHGPVDVAALDSYDLDDVAIVKIDVEGNEPAVLDGALRTLARCRPVVWAEAQAPDAVPPLAAHLVPLGYHLTATLRAATPMTRWEPTP